MKNSFRLFLIVILFLASSQIASSKGCQHWISYLRGGSYLNYTGSIDTTVSSTTVLHDPFDFTVGGDDCPDCWQDSVTRFFNGVRIPSGNILPSGMEGVFVSNSYHSGCQNTNLMTASMIVHIIGAATGILENSSSSGLQVFPNPFPQKIFFILTDDTDRLLVINIYDLNGRLIEHTSDHFDALNMKSEESGFYFYSVITEKGRNYKGKIFKE
jgi:hypothetical protein